MEMTYANIEQANSYCEVHQMKEWAGLSDMQKNAHLLQATLYIDGHYSFVGSPKSYDQELSWPRSGFDRQGRRLGAIPFKIQYACIELAYCDHLYGLDKPQSANDYVESSVTRVDVIEKSFKYRSDAPASQVFPKVESLLRDFIDVRTTQYLAISV